MRFLVLLASPDHHERWDAADDVEREHAFAAYRAFATAVRARGRIVAGDALEPPGSARTIHPGPAGRPEGRLVTDGPFAETVEQLGGFYLIDVPSIDDAIDVARLLPEGCTLEVRQCLGVDVGVG